MTALDQVGNDECPPKQGWAYFSLFGYTFPFDLPPGNYSWTFDASTPDGDRIFCVEVDKVCLEMDDGSPRNEGACPPVKDRATFVMGSQKPLL
jgi:hypothetical protein